MEVSERRNQTILMVRLRSKVDRFEEDSFCQTKYWFVCERGILFPDASLHESSAFPLFFITFSPPIPFPLSFHPFPSPLFSLSLSPYFYTHLPSIFLSSLPFLYLLPSLSPFPSFRLLSLFSLSLSFRSFPSLLPSLSLLSPLSLPLPSLTSLLLSVLPSLLFLSPLPYFPFPLFSLQFS